VEAAEDHQRDQRTEPVVAVAGNKAAGRLRGPVDEAHWEGKRAVAVGHVHH